MVIENGIPLPKKRHRRYGLSATIRGMAHGDSVVIDHSSLTAWRYAANMMGRGTRSESVGDDRVRLWVVDRRDR